MRTPTGRLLELVAELDRLGPAPTLAALGHAVARVPLTADDVAPCVQPTPQSYSRVPVVVRDAYDLLVMTWLPGQGSAPHDHSGSTCVTRVVTGRAVESSYSVAADGYVDLQYETAVHAGDVITGQDAGVHGLHNPSTDGTALVTVHVYSPPLRDVRLFRVRPGHAAAPRRDAERTPTVVVVGGGFSGTLTAAQTLRRAREAGRPARVVLVERRGTVGEGLAYATREHVHLLNVPAGRMSAWPDRPDDFVRWATARYREVRPTEFLPRAWYGEYAREALLAEAAAAGPGALTLVLDEARRVSRHPAGGWMVHLAKDPSLRADAVVLAVGHRPPADPIGGRWRGPRARFLADPWRPFATNVVGPDDPVTVLGSGLTAVDAVLSLCQHRRAAPITLLSRRGLLPQAHAPAPVAPADLAAVVAELTADPAGVRAKVLLRRLRARTRELAKDGGDWRAVVDGLRPHTARLWHAMPVPQRERFLARLRPFWEVHRHRMAGPVAERFRELMASGQVRLIAGHVETAVASDDGVRLTVKPRGRERLIEAETAWVINCTGPLPSNTAEANPVIGALLVAGLLRPDELSLGVETTADGRAVGVDGPVEDLFLVGTLRKSADWESTAVPELRAQAATTAEAVMRLLERAG